MIFMARKNESPGQAEALETAGKPVQAKFGKTRILGMKRYAGRADLLQVLLKPEETYALDAVDAAISDFMKGRVN
jgi:hypothetical protein